MTDLSDDELFKHLNQQTSKISWHELERYYAQGVVYLVDQELDLVKTAMDFIQDNVANIKPAIEAQHIRQINAEEAQVWHDENISLWAVVAAPWVLIQHIKVTTH